MMNLCNTFVSSYQTLKRALDNPPYSHIQAHIHITLPMHIHTMMRNQGLKEVIKLLIVEVEG